MEDSNQFDLNQPIEAWKNQLVKTGNFSADDIRELRDHLMDTIALIDKENLSEEELFLIAKHRIGSPELLEEAYQKRSALGFEKLSGFMQSIFYFLIWTINSMTFAIIASRIFIAFNSHSQGLYLGISFVFESFALLIVYFLFKRATAFKNTTGSTIKTNLGIFMALIISYGIHLTILYMYGPVGYASWGMITRFFYLMIALTIVIVFVVSNVREWRRKRLQFS